VEGLDRILAAIDPRLCVACKGSRGLCGIDPCPLLQRIQETMPRTVRLAPGRTLGRDLFGSSPPSLFVGRHGYPKVTVGPMLPPEHRDEGDARLLDAPRQWLGMSIPEVVGLRSSLLRTTHAVSVDMAARFPDRITRVAQELAVAARPVDTEVHLAKAPTFGLPTVGEFTPPHGPTAQVERAQLAENVRVERPVERATSDTDLRAGEALVELYRAGTDLYQLERILSAGMVGLGHKRRLVPTRWGITATDDQVGKALIAQVLAFPTIDKPRVHVAERFGNRFHVLLVPRVWSFDNVEAWGRGSFWTQAGGALPVASTSPILAASDWEDHTGRTTYAAATAGGYYATRLAVLEHLVALRRQATAIVLREVTDDYTTPLGVWVVRETTRLAMAAKPLEFEDLESAVRHIDRRALHKGWQADSRGLTLARTQRSLESFGA
jgi:DNA repair protein NreA